jgi:hypothetical protein
MEDEAFRQRLQNFRGEKVIMPTKEEWDDWEKME